MARADRAPHELAGAARAELPVESRAKCSPQYGQPHTPAVSKPVPADHNVHPTVRAPSHSTNNGGGRR